MSKIIILSIILSCSFFSSCKTEEPPLELWSLASSTEALYYMEIYFLHNGTQGYFRPYAPEGNKVTLEDNILQMMGESFQVIQKDQNQMVVQNGSYVMSFRNCGLVSGSKYILDSLTIRRSIIYNLHLSIVSKDSARINFAQEMLVDFEKGDFKVGKELQLNDNN